MNDWVETRVDKILWSIMFFAFVSSLSLLKGNVVIGYLVYRHTLTHTFQFSLHSSIKQLIYRNFYAKTYTANSIRLSVSIWLWLLLFLPPLPFVFPTIMIDCFIVLHLVSWLFIICVEQRLDVFISLFHSLESRTIQWCYWWLWFDGVPVFSALVQRQSHWTLFEVKNNAKVRA